MYFLVLHFSSTDTTQQEKDRHSAKEKLVSIGLVNLNLSLRSDECKNEMVDPIVRYEHIFSRHHLGCGRAEGFVSRIRLADHKPVILPSRRIPLSQYHN